LLANITVFLRVLGYFQGILFLTTNRVDCIDSAFKSCNHLFLYYSHLSPSARTSIWKTHIARASNGAMLPKALMDHLTNYDINGRQIKNTIRMACSIVANEQRQLCAEDILGKLEAWTEFEVDFGGGQRRGTLRRLRRGVRRYVWAKVMLACRFPAYFSKRLIQGRNRYISRRTRSG
jgi:hypothetical protein